MAMDRPIKLVPLWTMPDLSGRDIRRADQAEANIDGVLWRWRAWDGRQFTEREKISGGEEFSLAHSPIFACILEIDGLKIYRIVRNCDERPGAA